jgi:predicted MPP superfamily phosphohydrolase
MNKFRSVIFNRAIGAVLALTFLALTGVSRPALAQSAAAAEKYTIGWLSDTQRYSSSYPETFLTMTQYLRNAREKLNLGYVALTGDIVNKGSSKAQWRNARAALDLLAPIPFGVLAGNHDRNSRGVYTNFREHFGEAYFSEKPHYGGSYKDNLGHYDLITLGSTSYVFVYLSYQPNEEMIAWANNVFAAYPNRVGALCIHDYFDSRSQLRGMGRTLQREVVAKNKNLYLVLCGHRYTQDCIPIRFDDDGNGTEDRTVYQCIANYQTLKAGGQGYIRFLEIDESKGQLRFYTYSPLLDVYRAPPKSAKNKQETWPLPWIA